MLTLATTLSDGIGSNDNLPASTCTHIDLFVQNFIQYAIHLSTIFRLWRVRVRLNISSADLTGLKYKN